MSEPQRQPRAGSPIWQHWQMRAIDSPAPEPQSRTEDRAPQVDAQQIAEVLEQARAQGFEEGFAQGQAAGRRQGERAGHEQGQAAGYIDGMAQGQAAALEQARAEVARERDRLHTLIQSTAQALADAEQALGDQLIDLALDIARQVLRRELTLAPEAIVAVVQEQLRAQPAAQPALMLWLHPDDLNLVRTYLQDEGGMGHWRLYADERLNRGGCRAESAHGVVDASLDTRWHRVAASLGRDHAWQVEGTAATGSATAGGPG